MRSTVCGCLGDTKTGTYQTEPGQNLSIILAPLEHVEDKTENVFIDMLYNNVKTKHYVKSLCCKLITQI